MVKKLYADKTTPIGDICKSFHASGGWEYREEVSEVPPKIKDEINKRGYWAGATRAATE